MANKNFIVKNGLEVGGQEVVSSSGVVTSAALGGQTLASTDSPTFNNLTLTNDIAVGGDINLTGDLNITGDVNTLSVTDLDVTDQTITLGAGQVESASGGSGIVVDGSGASILWDETNDEWDFNKKIKVIGDIVTSQTIYSTGAITSVSSITANAGGNTVALSTDGAIEITRTGGGAYIDFKDSSSEDYDQRLQILSGNFNFTASGLSIAGSEFIDSSRNIDIGSGTISSGVITADGLTVDTSTLVVDATNNRVGIGTALPSSILHTRGTNITGGIFVEDSSNSGASPVIKVQGKRLDANKSQSFSGGITLESLYTGGLAPDTKHAGTIYFGINHTDGTASNIAYSASISGILEGDANSASDMPTGLVFYTGNAGTALGTANTTFGTERMRITSAGTVLVGKTAEGTATDGIELNRNDVIVATRNNDAPLILNRRSSDGDIIYFRKDNTTVGSIGNNGANIIYLAGAGSGVKILNPSSGFDGLMPCSTTGTDRDASMDLGSTNTRFQDLYLSGNAYVDTNATFGGYVRTKQYLQVYEGNSQAGFIGKEKNIVGSGSSLDMVIFAEGIAEGGDLHFMTGGSSTKRMSIDSSGKVGIGTSSPKHDLVVHNDSGPFIALVGDSYNDEMGIVFNGGDLTNASSAGNTGAKITSQLAVNGGQVLGDLRFITNSGDAFVDSMYIDTSGNVGIGNTNTDNFKLYVDSTSTGKGLYINAQDGGYTAIGFSGDGTATKASLTTHNGLIYIGSENSGGTGSNGELRIEPSTSERMRIDSSGNVGIGMQNVLQKFSVAGSVWASGYYITALQGNSQLTNASTSSGSNPSYIGQGLISVTVSDAKAKENFGSVETNECLNKIVSLSEHVKKFDWIDEDWKKEKGRTVGMVAQEIYEDHSEFVHKPENYDDDGWAIRYQEIVPTLVKAIQEQQTIIDDLKSRLDNAGL